MPLRASALAALGLPTLVACARMEPPPGGPPDRVPPQLVSVRPESLAVLPRFDGEVEFRFDEVVSEGGSPSQGAGTGDLERLVILSPTTRVPNVRWRRNRITVAPDEGWQPNRVYRVQLLPGVYDLRRNRSDTGAVVTFAIGAPAPQTTLTGSVIDWTTRRPVAGALVVAVLMPDSLPYRALADSNGTFSVGPLPGGDYIVYGVVDQDRNQRHDRREAFDSVRVAAGQTRAGELWAFVHDTTAPRIQDIAVDDSVSATITFAQMLDPRQRLLPRSVRLRLLPDSTPVAVTSILPKPIDDSLHRRPAARDTMVPADTTEPRRPPADTAAPRLGRGPRDVAQLTSRPQLFDRLTLRVPRPWAPGARFAVEIDGVRNVTGVVGVVRGVVAVPERKPEPAPADTLGAKQPSDTLR